MVYTHYYPTSQLFHGSLYQVMGTRLDVLLFGDKPALLDDIWQRMAHEVLGLHRMLNRFDADSELAQLSAGVLSPTDVSEELHAMLIDAQHYNALTEGLFNVHMPSQPYDFGGYAKGYALQRIGSLIQEASIQRALINFGNSSILAIGTHPHGDSWEVGVTHPFNGQEIAKFNLHQTSLSVSGNTPTHIAHIRHPRSGLYYEGRKVVMIVADSPVEAEVLSTALMLATEDEARRILPRFNIQHYQIYHDTN